MKNLTLSNNGIKTVEKLQLNKLKNNKTNSYKIIPLLILKP
jgi:hypothetical protein